MTVVASTSTQRSLRYDHNVDLFVAAGWTEAQWHAMHRHLAYRDGSAGATRLLRWLRDPYRGLNQAACADPPPPEVVTDFFTRYGQHAPHLLNAVSVGASERFTQTFLSYQRSIVDNIDSPDTSPAVHAWQYATTELGLSEPHATGWALTGYLHPRADQIGREWNFFADSILAAVTSQWITQFGPTAYLWILAGFTLAEASSLQQGGTNITEQQLRVMAALGGVVLPADV